MNPQILEQFFFFYAVTGALYIVFHVVAFGGLCAWLAQQKGYGQGAGWLIGILTGPFGLIAYAGLPDRFREPQGARDEGKP